jgi:CHASE2 domain-containing sensor protein
LVICALAAALLTGLPLGLRNALVDLRFHWFPRQASGDIVVVAIDPPSIETIGVWPWGRSLHAELIDALGDAGVSDILFDIDFSAPSNPQSDQALAEALRRAGGSVVLPSFEQLVKSGAGQGIHLNRPLPQFAKEAWPAIVNVEIEDDGLVRRYPYGETFDGALLPSMGAVLAGRFETSEKSFWVDFSIRPESIPQISYADVLRRDPATLMALADKKVIIGGTAIELGDRFSIPNGRVVPGVVVQALAAESILQDRALYLTSDLVRFAGAAFVVVLMLGLWPRLSAVPRLFVLGGVALAAEAGAMLLQATFPIMADTSLLQVAIGGYVAAIALDEIDLRGLIGRIAERRFERIAMSLGEGLVAPTRTDRSRSGIPALQRFSAIKPMK